MTLCHCHPRLRRSSPLLHREEIGTAGPHNTVCSLGGDFGISTGLLLNPRLRFERATPPTEKCRTTVWDRTYREAFTSLHSPEVMAGVEDEVVALASPGLGDGESEIGSFGHEGGFGGFSLTLVRDGPSWNVQRW